MNLSQLSIQLTVITIAASVVGIKAQYHANSLDVRTNPGAFVAEIPVINDEPEGDVYIISDWSDGQIALYSGQVVEKYRLKFDIRSDEVLIQDGDKVRALKGFEVQSFHLTNPKSGNLMRFVNAQDYIYNDTRLVGFLQILCEGELTIYARPLIEIEEGNYIAALDVGDRSDSYVKKEELYVSHGAEITKISKKKKETLPIFGDHQDKIANYLKENRLKLNRKEDLIQVCKFYNSL